MKLGNKIAFSVEFDRGIIKYHEGNHRMYIDRSTHESDPNTILVELKSINSWLSPFENEIISKEKRLEIFERVKRMIISFGHNCKFI
jgi:hypothetical protein